MNFNQLNTASFLGSQKNENSFSYNLFTGNTWHKQLENWYGEELVNGDKITMEVDMDNQTLSYKVNGKDYGVAFDEVPKRNVWFAC